MTAAVLRATRESDRISPAIANALGGRTFMARKLTPSQHAKLFRLIHDPGAAKRVFNSRSKAQVAALIRRGVESAHGPVESLPKHLRDALDSGRGS